MKQRNWHILGYDLTLTPNDLWIGAGVCLVLVIVLCLLVRRQLKRWKATPAVKAAAVVALAATGVSLNTSWRFFGDHFGLPDKAERAAIFAVLEGAQITFALLGRENQRSSAKETGKGRTGTPGLLVWVVSILALYPAWVEAGAVAGLARWLLGPMLAAVLWHFAMGLELKTEKIEIKSDGLVAVLWRQVREQLLARFGAAAPDRTALEIRQDSAMRYAVLYADRYASLTEDQRSTRRGRRMQRKLRNAFRVSEISTNPTRLREFITQLSAIRNVDGLVTGELRAPWEDMNLFGDGAASSSRPGSDSPGTTQRAAGVLPQSAGVAEGERDTSQVLDPSSPGSLDPGDASLMDANSADGLMAAILDTAGGVGKGDKKTAFTKMADEFVRAGDLRVWGDADNRVAFAYRVNDALPETLRVAQSTARRYAEVYASQNSMPEQRANGQIPHQAGERITEELGIGAGTT